MDVPVHVILNLVGFAVGLVIGTISAVGYRNTGSATLFRLAIAFFAISAGFCVIWVGFMTGDPAATAAAGGGGGGKSGGIERWVQTLGIGIQTVGYFFIAYSHGIKAFLPKNRYFRSVAVLPAFLASSVHIEHVFRSVSFILLTYGAIETVLSCLENKRRGTAVVALGLAMLALGEFLSWYSFVFPGSVLYTASNMIKIGGLIALFVPVGRIPWTRIRIEDGFPDSGVGGPDSQDGDK